MDQSHDQSPNLGQSVLRQMKKGPVTGLAAQFVNQTLGVALGGTLSPGSELHPGVDSHTQVALQALAPPSTHVWKEALLILFPGPGVEVRPNPDGPGHPGPSYRPGVSAS